MMFTPLVNRLSRWANISEADQAVLTSLPGDTITLPRGAHPLINPDPHQRSLVMMDGWAARYKDLAGGKRVICEILLPGDLLLEASHSDRSLRTTMLSPGSLRIICHSTVMKLLEHPRIGTAVAWGRSVQDSISREWLINIGANKVYARLAHLFCEISARMNTAGLLRDDTCVMPLTQADLADTLSTTIAHCNIALQRLRSEGLIRLKHQTLTIVNRASLEAIAQFDDRYLLRWPTDLPDRRKRSNRVQSPDRRHSRSA